MTKVKHIILLIIGIIFLAAGWKFALIISDVFPFNSDEAIVGLMARHIIEGEHPIFFYGQAYMGSLDAYLVAIGFKLFGHEVWVIRIIQTVLYICTILTTIWIGKKINRIEVGLVAGVLLSIPTVNTTLYTTVSLGGYGEALLIGNIIIIITLQILQRIKENKTNGNLLSTWQFVLLGFFIGFGGWVHGITLVYSVPALLLILFYGYKAHKRLVSIIRMGLLLMAGVGIGSLPIWIYGMANGLQFVFQELMGSAVAVEGGSYIHRVLSHLLNFILLGIPVLLGLRPPWEVRWLGLPIIPLILLFWALVCGFTLSQVKNKHSPPGLYLLIGICFTMIIGFLFTSFGVDPSGRYYLPLVIPLSLMAAGWLHHVNLSLIAKGAILFLLVFFNVWGTIDCARRNPPGITTQFDAVTQIDHAFDQELIDFLLAHGETTGYSNYWVAYPLIFNSGETLIFVPRMPYHQDFRYTSRDDRYAHYTELVNANSQVAYVTTNHAELDEYLRAKFRDHQMTWLEEKIGDYQVFYGLSEPLRPQMIGLGQ